MAPGTETATMALMASDLDLHQRDLLLGTLGVKLGWSQYDRLVNHAGGNALLNSALMPATSSQATEPKESWLGRACGAVAFNWITWYLLALIDNVFGQGTAQTITPRSPPQQQPDYYQPSG